MRDGFYLGTVTEITECGTDFKVIFTVKIYGREYHPSLMLDLDIMDKRTAFFMILAIGGCSDMYGELPYSVGKEMTIFVVNLRSPKVLLTYPSEMFEILKRNEQGYIHYWVSNYMDYNHYIVGGLRNSYISWHTGALYYESIFDDDFAEKLSEIKKLSCPYVVPEKYYETGSGPSFK